MGKRSQSGIRRNRYRANVRLDSWGKLDSRNRKWATPTGILPYYAPTTVTGQASAAIGFTANAAGGTPAVTYEGAGTLAENGSAATTIDVAYPSSPAVDDLILLWVSQDASATTTPQVPAGFTDIGHYRAGASSPGMRLCYKISDGTETGSVAVTTANTTSKGQMLLLRGADTTTPVEDSDSYTSGSAVADYPIPSVTAGDTGRLIVVAAICNSNTATWAGITVPGTFTDVTADVDPIPSTQVAVYEWAGSGATGTITANPTGSVRGAAVALVFQPPITSGSVSGSGSAPIGVTATAAGVPEVFGVATSTLAAAATANGVDRSVGQAASTITVTATAAGVDRAVGQAAATLGGTATASGYPTTHGTAASSLTATATAAGYPTTHGTATAALTVTATASGAPRRSGAAVATLAVAAAAAGIPEVFGQAVAALAVTATASGVAGTPPVTGQATAALAVTATAAGHPTALGAGTATLTVTAVAVGVDRSVGVAVATLEVTATAAGSKRVYGVAGSALLMTATADGTVISASVDLGHLVTGDAEPNRYQTASTARYDGTGTPATVGASSPPRYGGGSAAGNRYGGSP